MGGYRYCAKCTNQTDAPVITLDKLCEVDFPAEYCNQEDLDLLGAIVKAQNECLCKIKEIEISLPCVGYDYDQWSGKQLDISALPGVGEEGTKVKVWWNGVRQFQSGTSQNGAVAVRDYSLILGGLIDFRKEKILCHIHVEVTQIKTICELKAEVSGCDCNC